METKTVLKLTAVALGAGIAYAIIAQRENVNPKMDVLRYSNEDALRRAQTRGMASDYREMERAYERDLVRQPAGIV